MGKVIFKQEGDVVPGFIERPSQQATLESQVWVPFWWALITAMIFLAGALLFSRELDLSLGLALKMAFWVGLFVFCAAWLWLSGRLRGLLQSIEPFVGKDLDGDGKVGKGTTIRVEVKQNGKIRKYFDPDVFDFYSDEAFIVFAQKLLNSGSLTEATWGKDKKAFPGGINMFRKTRGELEAHGYIVRKGNTWEPTDELLDICEQVLKHRGYEDESADSV